MWPATSFVFNAWLKFLLAGAMTQTMVTIVAAMTTTAIERLCAVVASYAGANVSLVAFGALFLAAALIAWLFLSVPRLASGLVAGTALGIQGWTAAANAGRTTRLAPTRQLPRQGAGHPPAQAAAGGSSATPRGGAKAGAPGEARTGLA